MAPMAHLLKISGHRLPYSLSNMMSNLSPATAATGSATPGDIRPADDQVTDSQNEIEQANIENSQQQTETTKARPGPSIEQDVVNADATNKTVAALPTLIDSEALRRAKYDDVDTEVDSRYRKQNRKKVKRFYTKQNELIDQFLGVEEEEQNASDEEIRMRPRIRFAVYASFTANLCLFVIQMYAAISTGSLSLFATAADAFMDLVSSCVMLITSKLARRPSIYKFPVGRTRIEPVGIIVFCALMATVAVQLLIESARNLAAGEHEAGPLKPVPLALVGVAILMKSSMMVYCFFYRRFPSVHVFFIDHRNDIVVNVFGLIMAIVGDHFIWYLDPIGAICIALLILFSWAANAFEQVWLLAGKGAPKTYVSRLIYVTLTHSTHILKVDTCRAYHAGQKYWVEVDVVMDADTPLRTSHDVSQSLQRKLEGLGDVERAFVHVDYEHDHNVHEEHKPLYENVQLKTLRDYFRSFLRKSRT